MTWGRGGGEELGKEGEQVQYASRISIIWDRFREKRLARSTTRNRNVTVALKCMANS